MHTHTHTNMLYKHMYTPYHKEILKCFVKKKERRDIDCNII